MTHDDLLAVGKVVGPHGVAGAVKLNWFSGIDGCDLAKGDRVALRHPDQRVFSQEIVWIRPHRRQLLVGFAGIHNRDAAAGVIGADVVMRRSELAETDPDEYYWTDLVGLRVETVSGQPLGILTRILETGSNDVYVVQGDGAELLLPALASVVRRVDLTGGLMQVDLPDGIE